MKVRHSLYGRLTGALGGPLGVLIANLPIPWQAMLVLVVVVVIAMAFWLDRRGVFDTADGGVVIKRAFTTERIAASAEPAIAFDKVVVGYRLVIANNDGRRMRTGIRGLKPALSADLTPPSNLRVPAVAEAHSG